MAGLNKNEIVYLSSWDSTDYAYESASNITIPIGKTPSNTSYASISLVKGSNAESYIYYIFDLSGLPSNAIIISVSCIVKAAVSNTQYFTSGEVQLFNGTVAKGSSQSIMNTTAQQYTLDVGTWTKEELNNCRLRLYAQRITSNSAVANRLIYMQLYGAKLTVAYQEGSISGSVMIDGSYKTLVSGYCNIGGVFKPIVKSYVNVDGVWLPT